MALSKAALWLVMAMVALATLACVGVVLLAEQSSEFTYLLLISLLTLALLAPLVVVLHRTQYRAGGTVLCGVFLSLWIGLLMSVLGLHPDSSQIMVSVEVFFIIGIPTGVALMCLSKPWGRWFAWSLTGIAVLCAGPTLLGVWNSSSSNPLYEKLALCGLLVFCQWGTGTVLLINVGRRDRRYFRWPGVGAALVAGAATLVAALKPYDSHTDLWYFTAGACWTAAATLALVNLLLMTWRPGLVRWLQWIAIGLTLCAGGSMITLLWAQLIKNEDYLRWTFRLTGTAFTLVIGAILEMLVARTMLRLKPKPTAPNGITQVKLHCPVCGTLQDMNLHGACHHCLVQFHITLAEPHCPACQYLILNLTSDRCPECGAAIQRPATASPSLTTTYSQEKM